MMKAIHLLLIVTFSICVISCGGSSDQANTEKEAKGRPQNQASDGKNRLGGTSASNVDKLKRDFEELQNSWKELKYHKDDYNQSLPANDEKNRLYLSRVGSELRKIESRVSSIEEQLAADDPANVGSLRGAANELDEAVKLLRKHVTDKDTKKSLNDVEDLGKHLKALEKEIQKINVSPPAFAASPQVKATQEQPSDESPLFPSLTTLLLALFPILLIAAAGWWLNRRVDGLESRLNKMSFDGAQMREQTDARLENVSRSLSICIDNINALQDALPANLTSEIERLKSGYKVMQQRESTPPRTPVVNRMEPEPAAARHIEQRPGAVSVYEYLNRKSDGWIKAKTAMMRAGILQRDSNADAPFVLAPSGSRNQFMVLPSVIRFSSAQEYWTYYQSFYECDQPAAGEVWIIEPALAQLDSATGEWQLSQKGRLKTS